MSAHDTGPGVLPFRAHAIVPRGLEHLRHLGNGSMGSVTLARDLDLDRLVAVKTLAPRLAAKPGRAELFRREAAMLARVRSTWVVGVHAFGVHEGLPYFVMEHVDGASLRALLDEHRHRGARISLSRALGILRQVAQGLGDLHGHGLVHRDLKPENVVVEHGTGRPVIVDLGLGAPADLDDGMRHVGTLHYMAPEVLSGEQQDASPAQDVYAYGCVLFEVLTGRKLLPQRSAELVLAAQRAGVPSFASCDAGLARLDGLLSMLCAADPRARPKDGHAVARMLMEAAHGLESAADGRDSVLPSAPSGLVRVVVGEENDAVRRFHVRCATVALFGTRTEVITARDGVEAQAAFGHHAPELVILDHGLRGTNGVVVLEQLRARIGGDRTRVVIVASEIDDETRRRYDALGVDLVLEKPVAFDRLVHALASLAGAAGWVSSES